MSEMSPERKRVVVLCAAVACMSGGPVLLRGHQVWLAVWIAVMAVTLVSTLVQMAQLKRRGL
jgi:hypothetical protein